MIVTPMGLSKTNDTPHVFKQVWNHDIENLDIPIDVCKKLTFTPMELLKTIVLFLDVFQQV